MTKFAIKTEYFQFDPTKYTVKSAWESSDDHNDVTHALFDTLQEAFEVFWKYEISVRKLDNHHAEATVRWIEESDYEQDEDGEWEFISGSDIWCFQFDHLNEHIIDILKEADYDRRITVMTPEEAREFVEETKDADDEELTAIDVFGYDIPISGYVLYALPPSGYGQAFVYDEFDKWSHLDVEARQAFEHAYGRELEELK